MKWKLLFDSNAALGILPNFSDRLVYSFPSMHFSASFQRNVWASLAHLTDEKKCSDTFRLFFHKTSPYNVSTESSAPSSKTSSMMILLNLLECKSPFNPITLPSCYYMTDFTDILTGCSIQLGIFERLDE